MSTDIDFDRIFYFGDSLTDSDEIFAATSAVAFLGLPPLAAGYAGQFSNGDVYSDLVPDLLSATGGEALNYAVGGAQVLTDRTVGEFLAGSGLIRPDATADDLAFGVDYGAQVERFLTDFGGTDLSDAAVSILVGVNDINDFAPTSFDPVVVATQAFLYGSQIAQATLTITGGLIAAGVGTVIFNTIPSAIVFPFFQQITPVEQALAQLITQGYNAALRAGVEQLEVAGVNAVIVDWGTMLEEVAIDSESFGFRLFDQQFLLGTQGSGGINPAFAGVPIEQVGFYDSVHPTAELHEIMGVFQAESLTSEVEIGTETGDKVKGTHEDDLVLGRDGDDRIKLGKGDDIAIGGLGNDKVFGGTGSDLLAGGSGNDRLHGQSGDDIIADGNGADRSIGGGGNDLMIDGAGSDLAIGGCGDDVFIFTQASVYGRETDGMDFFNGGSGNDTLVLRLLDVNMDLGLVEQGCVSSYEALGLTTTGIENVIIVAGVDIPTIAGFEDALQTTDLWHFI
jgi:phospholipase/lecithinase/hemolysin